VFHVSVLHKFTAKISKGCSTISIVVVVVYHCLFLHTVTYIHQTQFVWHTIRIKSKFRSLITKFSIKFQNFKTGGARLQSLAPSGQQLSFFEILKFFGNHSRIFITIKLFCLKTFTMSRATFPTQSEKVV